MSHVPADFDWDQIDMDDQWKFITGTGRHAEFFKDTTEIADEEEEKEIIDLEALTLTSAKMLHFDSKLTRFSSSFFSHIISTIIYSYSLSCSPFRFISFH